MHEEMNKGETFLTKTTGNLSLRISPRMGANQIGKRGQRRPTQGLGSPTPPKRGRGGGQYCFRMC